MASAMRRITSFGVNLLMHQNAKRVPLTSARHVLSQVKLVDQYDQCEHIQDYGRYTEHKPRLETFKVHMNKTEGNLHISLENVTTDLQKDLINNFGLFLNNSAESEHLQSVNYNFISEEIYRYILYKPYRKLGYDCVFTRYNNDKGLASFKIEENKDHVRYNVYKSVRPNPCL